MRSSFGKVFMGAAGTPTGASDDEFNRVSFLSHFEGANNGVNSAFDDGSTSNHTINANGNVTQGSFGPFARPDGEFAVHFDGDDYLSVAETSADEFTFGTGNFTIEGWINNQAVDASRAIITTAEGTDFQGIWFGIHESKYYLIYNNSGGWSVIVHASTPVVNAWTHFAVVRNGTSNVVYINGSSIGSTTETARDLTNTNNLITIGGRGNQRTISTMSNVRVVKGTAVYTGNFTPSTSKLTAITNTKLLTCQSNRFVDNSASPLTITPAGNPAVSAFGPFLTDAVYDPAVNGASAYFDGNGDYLTIAASNDFDLSDGDITWEFFVYPTEATSVGGNQLTVFEYYTNDQNFYRVIVTNNDVSIFQRSSGDYGLATSNDCVPTNSWAHVAVTRASNNEHKIFCNGVLLATSTMGQNALVTASRNLVIGRGQLSPGNRYFPGYITDFRLTKGSLVYTSNFTPPTAPLTAITNTKLLLNMADGQAIDSAAQNNLTLVGTAKTSTAQKLFGTASLLLDGNSDLVTFPSEAGNFGTGNFTIEFSFRLAADVGSTPFVAIAKWETSGDQRSWMVRMDSVSSANKMIFYESVDGDNFTATQFATSFSNQTWYKIAIVNVSGTVSLYVNGTADSTTRSLATGAPYASTGLVSIGANIPSSPSQFFNGNIDEVRLSKFARYTGNYTAQSEPFPDKGK